jgi:hypothetical protein
MVEADEHVKQSVRFFSERRSSKSIVSPNLLWPALYRRNGAERGQDSRSSSATSASWPAEYPLNLITAYYAFWKRIPESPMVAKKVR